MNYRIHVQNSCDKCFLGKILTRNYYFYNLRMFILKSTLILT